MGYIPNSAEARDAAYVLHPNTNAKTLMETGPLIIERGEGIYVYDANGKRYIESMAGLWSAAVGFNERRLIDAASKQMGKLPFYHNFFSKSHEPLINLSEKLVDIAPVPMEKVFFTNSGSEANDTAIKLIWYRSNALGQSSRKKIISRARAYHGGTIAAGSLTGLSISHRSFDIPLPGFLHVGSPHFWRDGLVGETEVEFSSRRANELEQLIEQEGPETIAAFFAEPVIGAGGVLLPPETYWEQIQAVLTKYDILLVADEVICGFGRTGRMFGCETYNIKPDIMVLSKALSSSYMPIAALLMNERVAQPIIAETDRIGALGHGFTNGGHPVAAAVSLESINIIEERDLVANAARAGARLLAGLKSMSDHALVGEVRGVGLMAAVELVIDKAEKRALDQVGLLGAILNRHLHDLGVISRNLGDAIAFCPPLVISDSQVDDLLAAFSKALDLTKIEIERGV